MTFSSATGGAIHFKQTIPSPGLGYNATFIGFTQTLGVFNPPTDQLIVTLSIVFQTVLCRYTRFTMHDEAGTPRNKPYATQAV
jgi:hypothetical protein